MKTINLVADKLSKNLAILSVVFAVFALAVPSFWIALAGSVSLDLSGIPFLGQHFPKLGFVNMLLGIIMLGMGMTLTTADFALILKRPRDVLIGVLSQFVYMAGFGFLIAKLITMTNLAGPEVSAQIAVGMVLLGAVPGGTASNVLTFLARGDVPLSITLTMCSTLLAPVLTPALTLALAGQWVSVNFWSMFFSIVVVVLVPVLLGLAIHSALGERIDAFKKVLVMMSAVCILIVVGSVVGGNQKVLASNGMSVILLSAAAVFAHHVLGLAAGYATARFFKFPEAKTRALSLEVGLQNSGLASTLAASAFPGTMVVLPNVLATIIHQVVGPIVANMFASRDSQTAVAPLNSETAATAKTI